MVQTYGYAGRILKIDLSSKTSRTVPSEDYARFIGGREEVPPEASAFSEDNRLIFAIGPLAGIPVIGGSRWGVYGKSPATTPETFNYSNLGGRWGAELKFAGYDGVVIRGRAEKPLYVLVHDDTVEFRDASALWGKGAARTRELIKSELGSDVRVVAIGPAGENLVSAGGLLADADASGSAGLGAVMGSKHPEKGGGGPSRETAAAHRLPPQPRSRRFHRLGYGFRDQRPQDQERPLLRLPGQLPPHQIHRRQWHLRQVHVPVGLVLSAVGLAILRTAE